MLLKSTILEVFEYQKQRLLQSRKHETIRNMLQHIKSDIPFIHIITGIRRCGKSTLLKQFTKKTGDNFFYLNFEDPKLTGFEINDFNKIKELKKDKKLAFDWWFFDEIQNINNWEKFIRSGHDEGTKIVLTGSNASLLSRELGSRLTGRHFSYELYPFSYDEFLRFKNLQPGKKSFNAYMLYGGFPEYLKYEEEDILTRLLDDIIYRDIAARHNIRNDSLLRELTVYLLSNAGNLFTYNSLKKTFSSGSANTIIDYISCLADAYLIFTVPKFDYSLKKQIGNARKIYGIDTGLANVASIRFSNDFGRQLENLVFLYLKRQGGEIYYFQGKNECDFIIKKKNEIAHIIQVCYALTYDNMERELAGLEEAMNFFNTDKGVLIALDDEDKFTKKGLTINIVPAYKWMANGG
ncbi:ATP-binding protein [Bacteroidota bacterium]